MTIIWHDSTWHKAAKWLSSPQGAPSGVCTGQMNPVRELLITVYTIATYPKLQVKVFEQRWFSSLKRMLLDGQHENEKDIGKNSVYLPQ